MEPMEAWKVWVCFCFDAVHVTAGLDPFKKTNLLKSVADLILYLKSFCAKRTGQLSNTRHRDMISLPAVPFES